MERIEVLQVEDNELFANLVEEYLSRESAAITVTTATDPEEALVRISEESFDCIVCDYEMPGMNGLDVLEAVRAEHPDLPFIVFTAEGSEEVASRAISAGASDYFRKEGKRHRFTLLANRIESLVSEHRARESARKEERGKVALFENAVDPIVEVELGEATSRIRDVNPAFEATFEYDREAVAGELVRDALVPPEEHEEHERFTRLARDGETVEATVTRRTATGRTEFLLRIIPVDIESGPKLAYAWYLDLDDVREEATLRHVPYPGTPRSTTQ